MGIETPFNARDPAVKTHASKTLSKRALTASKSTLVSPCMRSMRSFKASMRASTPLNMVTIATNKPTKGRRNSKAPGPQGLKGVDCQDHRGRSVNDLSFHALSPSHSPSSMTPTTLAHRKTPAVNSARLNTVFCSITTQRPKTKMRTEEGNPTPWHGRKRHPVKRGFSSPRILENPSPGEDSHEIRDHPTRDNPGR